MGATAREKVAGSGVYYVFVNHNGKRTARKVGDKTEAEKIAKKINAAITLGHFKLKPKEEKLPNLDVYSKLWLETQVKGILSDSTYERYGDVLNRDITPFFGSKTLDQIEVKDVRDFINLLYKSGRTSRSIGLSRTVLSSCLSEAVVENLIKENPVKQFSQNRKRSKTVEARRPRKHSVTPFQAFEVKRYINFAMQKSPEGYGPMFLFGFRTGVRLGELTALHWSDIDWENGRVHIQRARTKKGKIEKVKTGRERYVDMSAQLLDVLAKLLKTRKADKDGTKDQICEIIFHYKGHYLAHNTVRKAFKKYIKEAGLREIRVHDMRHTYASQLLSNSASLAYVKEKLGHSSIKTTVDFYGHLVPGSFREAVDKLDEPISTDEEESERCRQRKYSSSLGESSVFGPFTLYSSITLYSSEDEKYP